MLITPNSQDYWDSQVVLVVKNMTTNAGDIRVVVSIPGQKDPLRKGILPPNMPL